MQNNFIRQIPDDRMAFTGTARQPKHWLKYWLPNGMRLPIEVGVEVEQAIENGTQEGEIETVDANGYEVNGYWYAIAV